MAEALITGDIIRWARLRAGTSLDAVAEHLGVPATKLDEWERGISRPTFAKARDLAKTLRVPFAPPIPTKRLCSL